MLAVGELGVMDAGEPEIVGTAALEEFEIARVVDDAGEVGVGVVDPRHQPMAERRQRAGEPGRRAIRSFTMFPAIATLSILLHVGLT